MGKKKGKKGSSSTKPIVSVKPGVKNKKTKNKTKNMSAWDGLFVPPPVLRALEELNFTSPTPIQCLTLPVAIRNRQDILGAAETGSGKTLAFGIPMISRILEIQAEERRAKAISQEPTGEEDMDVDVDALLAETSVEKDDWDLPPDEEELLYTWKDGEIELLLEEIDPSTGEVLSTTRFNEEPEEDRIKPQKNKDTDSSVQSDDETRLYGLVLTPTRELAIQVARHLQAVAVHTSIKVALIYGGMSEQKQERLLRRRPEIVVATPGRLWEFIQNGEPHLRTACNLSVLVIDEADRMAEAGHFAEMRSLIDWMKNSSECHENQRQTLVFSATLTFVHAGQVGGSGKMKTLDYKIKKMTDLLGLSKNVKMIDVTQRVESLTEWRLKCPQNEKDLYLYWFIRNYPGRILVFCNSKDGVRRLDSVLSLLQCEPRHLHSDMHQRQRLKNLEKFTENPNGLLLATDVAARGLDIPNVERVVHFDVPRTAEGYTHRSGRTARAQREGASLVLIAPEEAIRMRTLCVSLKRREDEMPILPIGAWEADQLRPVVALARSIDKTEHTAGKSRSHADWFRQAAQEADIDYEESGDDSDSQMQSHKERKMKSKLVYEKRQLNDMLVELGSTNQLSRSTNKGRQEKNPNVNGGRKDGQQQKQKKSAKMPGGKVVSGCLEEVTGTPLDLLVSPRYPAMRTTLERLAESQAVKKKIAKKFKKKKR